VMLLAEENGVKAEDQWRIAWGVPGVVALGILLAMLRAPSSPRWLVLVGRNEEAVATLRYLRPTAPEETLRTEVKEMEKTIAESEAPLPSSEGGAVAPPGPCDGCMSSAEKHRWSLLLSARRAVIIGCGLVSLQQLTGQPSVLYYSQSIFEAAGFSDEAAKYSDLIVGGAKLIATLVSVPLVDRAGRRPLLLVGTVVMLFALVILSVAYGASDDGELTGVWPDVVLFALVCYVSGYQLGFGPITWVLIGEVFPLHSRTRAIGAAAVLNFAFNMLVTLTNDALLDAVGQAAIFSFYTFMCILSLGFMYNLVPETKGKTLEEIDAELKGTGAKSK